jgi:hypothetical protein
MATNTTPYNNFVPQMDYTSRDFSSISSDLENLIQYYLPAWTNRDTSDFGMTLLELFSYVGDNLSFYIDRAMNESFLTTASQRSSVIDIATLLNYSPANARAATTQVTFTNNTSGTYTVPAGTQVATTTVVNSNNQQIVFEVQSATLVPPGSTTGVIVNEGSSYTDPIIVSDGLATQTYQLKNAPVVDQTVSVTVDSTVYTYMSSLIDASATDPVFTTSFDDLGNSFIVFGDGVNGRVPPINNQITVTYRVGSGSAGNVPAGSINKIITNTQPGLTVSQPNAAIGGSDQEATDSIRQNTPKAISTLNRVVTLNDYANYVTSYLNADKANAVGNSFSSVVVYAAQAGDPGQVSGTLTSAFTALAANIQNGLANVIYPTTTVTVLPPSYVNIDVSVTVTVAPNRKASAIQTAVNAAIADLLSFTNTSFADTIRQTDVQNACNGVDGVTNTVITLLNRDGSTGVIDVTTQYFEIPQALTITVTTVGGI